LRRFEIANGFQIAIRRKRIATTFRDQAIGQLTAMPIKAEADTVTNAWTTTFDKQLVAAAKALGLRLRGGT
jgi:hypothetical protein